MKILKWIKEEFGFVFSLIANTKKDKWLHFFSGMLITLVVGVLLSIGDGGFTHVIRGILVGTITGVFAGITKEVVWDWGLKKGTPDLVDLWVTFLGVGVGASLIGMILPYI